MTISHTIIICWTDLSLSAYNNKNSNNLDDHRDIVANQENRMCYFQKLGRMINMKLCLLNKNKAGCFTFITFYVCVFFFSFPFIQACLLPTPTLLSCGNYARCVNQSLQGLTNMQVHSETCEVAFFESFLRNLHSCAQYEGVTFILQLWLRIPLVSPELQEAEGTPREDEMFLVSHYSLSFSLHAVPSFLVPS